MVSGLLLSASQTPRLILIGASVRAAAFSALRAGFSPICLDQFADADLQAAAQASRVEDLSGGLLTALDPLEPWPVVYTGGLENEPELLARIAEKHPLYGNSPDVLRCVRDPALVADALGGLKMPVAEIRSSDAPPPPDGNWLIKPLASAGGKGIAVWDSEARESATLARPHYFQQRVEGLSCSAVFIARPGVGDIRFVGLTEQIIGEPQLNAGPFAWCGNIGPLALSVAAEGKIRRIGNFLKWKFQLQGLFGIDFVVSPDETVWLTEINPRYPASTELLEFVTGSPLLADHCSCFAELPEELSLPAWSAIGNHSIGKGVVYSRARVGVQFTAEFQADGYATIPRYADVPPPGTVVQAGEPICTVYAAGGSLEQCRQNLLASARAILGTA